jgi:LmbE family N-acetylglucosaminyl deacetylase
MNPASSVSRSDRVLVIAAHPDDEVLGCGGTMALLSQSHEVRILILGEGITARADVAIAEAPAQLADLHEDAHAAARLLGATVWLGGLPDNRLDTLPLLELTQRIEAKIQEFEPTIIFTHFPGDLNVDHRQIFEAVMIATRPIGSTPVREIHCFEVLSSTEWSFGQVNRPFNPQLFYDISTTIELKVEAMARYRSELRTFPHPRSIEGIRFAAARWGSVIGVKAAEAFVTVRQFRGGSFPNL